jgi:hypothetical protein
MRGKLVIGVIFLFATLYGLYSVWYVSTLSPIDQRFNMNKKAIPVDVPEPALLPSNIGDFRRLSFEAVAPDAQNQRSGRAVYGVPSGGEIHLTVSTVADPADLAKNWIAAANPLATCDLQARSIVPHPEAKYPYAYGTCSTQNNTYSEFVWLNNQWLIRVTAPNSGDLLQFANNYAF